MVFMVYPEAGNMCMIYALLLLYLCVCMYPHIIEAKGVYGVYQYIFSCEESMCWVCIIYSPSTPPHSELLTEECHPV